MPAIVTLRSVFKPDLIMPIVKCSTHLNKPYIHMTETANQYKPLLKNLSENLKQQRIELIFSEYKIDGKYINDSELTIKEITASNYPKILDACKKAFPNLRLPNSYEDFLPKKPAHPEPTSNFKRILSTLKTIFGNTNDQHEQNNPNEKKPKL